MFQRFGKSLLAISCTLFSASLFADDLESRIADLWYGTDTSRIEFVTWVNSAQPFRGLSEGEVRTLLGEPDAKHPNRESPYNGLESDSDRPDGRSAPTTWIFTTIRPGTKESHEWGGEGSGYLMDLEIHFGADGVVYGCGTTQFVSGGEYYEMLDERRSTQ